MTTAIQQGTSPTPDARLVVRPSKPIQALGYLLFVLPAVGGGVAMLVAAAMGASAWLLPIGVLALSVGAWAARLLWRPTIVTAVGASIPTRNGLGLGRKLIRREQIDAVMVVVLDGSEGTWYWVSLRVGGEIRPALTFKYTVEKAASSQAERMAAVLGVPVEAGGTSTSLPIRR